MVAFPLSRATTWSQIISMLFVVAAVLGCGQGNWKSQTHTATGKVTINGEFPEGAIVELKSVGTPPDIRNSIPWGVVQSDGTYSLSTYQLGDGVPKGEYVFTVTWPWDPTAAFPVDRLGNAYSDAEKSEWKVTIQSGENELSQVDITGAKIASRKIRNREATP